MTAINDLICSVFKKMTKQKQYNKIRNFYEKWHMDEHTDKKK